MKTTSIAVHVSAVLAISIVSANAGVNWTAQAKDAIAGAALQRDAAESALALVRTAMSEASKQGAGNGNNGSTAVVDHHAAAASVAAYVILECLFPERRPRLGIALAVDLADFPETDQKAVALAEGRRAATELLRSSAQPCRPNVHDY